MAARFSVFTKRQSVSNVEIENTLMRAWASGSKREARTPDNARSNGPDTRRHFQPRFETTSMGTWASGQTIESSSSVLVTLHQAPEQAQVGTDVLGSSRDTAKVSTRTVSVNVCGMAKPGWPRKRRRIQYAARSAHEGCASAHGLQRHKTSSRKAFVVCLAGAPQNTQVNNVPACWESKALIVRRVRSTSVMLHLRAPAIFSTGHPQ